MQFSKKKRYGKDKYLFVGIAIIVIKPISFLGDNVLFFFYYYNLRVKSKEMPEAGKVSNVFEFSDIV